MNSQKQEETKRSYLSTLITMILAVTIIVVGFISPGIIYSAAGSDRDQITVLADLNSEDTSLHVFDDPVSLYPWNLYNADNTSSLSYSDQNFLREHNVPSFLITTMAAYGMDSNLLASETVESPIEYVTDVLVYNFSFLTTNAEANQGCYLIYSLDINGDSLPDLRCAVDQNGVIISLLFLSEPWIDSETAVEQDQTPTDEGTPTGNTPEVPVETPPENTTQENETTDNTGQTEGAAVEGSPYALVLDGLERTPTGEEYSLWSYAHLIALIAAENGQLELSAAASLLDAGFAERYGSPEAVANTTAYSPTPSILASEEYLLYIYDLPNDTRFILYYDSAISRCVGFDLQL